MLPDRAVYWAIQSLLEVGYIPLADGNDVFQWPGSTREVPLKSENLYIKVSDSFVCLPTLYLLLFIIIKAQDSCNVLLLAVGFWLML